MHVIRDIDARTTVFGYSYRLQIYAFRRYECQSSTTHYYGLTSVGRARQRWAVWASNRSLESLNVSINIPNY